MLLNAKPMHLLSDVIRRSSEESRKALAFIMRPKEYPTSVPSIANHITLAALTPNTGADLFKPFGKRVWNVESRRELLIMIAAFPGLHGTPSLYLEANAETCGEPGGGVSYTNG